MDSPVVPGRVRAVLWPAFVGALLLVALLFLAHRYCTHSTAFNSDNLLVFDFGEHLLGRGPEVQGYHLPNAPYLFPDVPLMLASLLLCKGLFATFLTYSLLYYTLMLAALTALFRQTGLRPRDAFLSAGSGLLLLLVTHLDEPYQWRAALMFHAGNHAGAVLVGLFLTLLVVRNLHRRVPWLAAVLFVLAGGLGLFSDRLLLPQFLAPICLAVGALALCRVVTAVKAAETVLLTGGAYALAVGLQRAFGHYFTLLPLGAIVDPAEIGTSLRLFLDSLPWCLEGQHLLKGAFVAFVCAGAVVALRPLWSLRPAVDEERRAWAAVAAVALIGLGCCACNVGAVIVSGVVRFQGYDRYLLGAAFLPFLLVGLCCRFLPGRRLQWLGRVCPAAVVVFACVQLGVRHGAEFSFAELRTPYPELARVLDRLAREKKIGSGLATFWNARQLRYLTEERVPLCTVLADGDPWLHAQNPNSLLSSARRSLQLPHYNFIVFNERTDPVHTLNRATMERRFGTPRETVKAGRGEVWLYDGLLGTELNLFLRSTLAHRCRRAQPYLGPASPAALGMPKENGTGPQRPGTVELAPDGEVRLTFAGPVTGELIDVGAQFDAHFDLRFYRGEELLGTLYVPRVNVPNVSASYRMAGNQSRLLTLPPGVRGVAWTSVVVRARSGPGCFALGHFLVYPEMPPGLRTRQTPPGGRWRFEAETQPGQFHGPDAVVDDSTAGGGRARFVPRDFAGLVVHGPRAFLEGGRYRVDFLMKAEVDAAEGPVARVEVTSQDGQLVHARRVLDAADFAGRPGYRKFSVELETEVELADCEFRVFAFRKVPLYVDYVEAECVR